jgi:hypothetical protein
MRKSTSPQEKESRRTMYCGGHQVRQTGARRLRGILFATRDLRGRLKAPKTFGHFHISTIRPAKSPAISTMFRLVTFCYTKNFYFSSRRPPRVPKLKL